MLAPWLFVHASLGSPVSSPAGSSAAATVAALWPHCDEVFVDLGAYDGNTIEAWYMLPDFFSDDAVGSYLGGQWVNPTKRKKELAHLDAEYARCGMPTVSERQSFCAIGFEGNPIFDGSLARLSKVLARRGKTVHMYSSTAIVSGHSNPVTFFTMGGNKTTVFGGLQKSTRATTPVTVPSVDVVDLVRELNARAKRVIVKIDIEHAEVDLLNGMLSSGELCSSKSKITNLLVEFDDLRNVGNREKGANSANRNAASRLMKTLKSPECQKTTLTPWY